MQYCSVLARQGFCTIVLHFELATSRPFTTTEQCGESPEKCREVTRGGCNCQDSTVIANLIVDRIWENPPCGIYSENRVWCMFDKLYHRANLRLSFRPIASFIVEIQCFACDCVTSPIIKKLRSKGVAMHAYGISASYARTGSQLNGPGQGHLKWKQRSSKDRISSFTTADSSFVPKKLKRWANLQ